MGDLGTAILIGVEVVGSVEFGVFGIVLISNVSTGSLILFGVDVWGILVRPFFFGAGWGVLKHKNCFLGVKSVSGYLVVVVV